jgi:transposase-like protein
MQLNLRIECPHCKWGYKWDDNYINSGWNKLQCKHCNREFKVKITISGFQIEIQKECDINIGEIEDDL